ncbi:MAG: hypothetical protein RMK57_01385 [Bryobacterales bacterium]|nr:hypothetical protein [Bryobacterales bacterium]
MCRPRRCIVLLLGCVCGAADFDVILRGVRVADGSGNPWFVADIGIRGDTIAAMGTLAGRSTKVEIQANGLTAVPDFIDIHSQGRRGIFESPAAENYIRQGVTASPTSATRRLVSPRVCRKPSGLARKGGSRSR